MNVEMNVNSLKMGKKNLNMMNHLMKLDLQKFIVYLQKKSMRIIKTNKMCFLTAQYIFV